VTHTARHATLDCSARKPSASNSASRPRRRPKRDSTPCFHGMPTYDVCEFLAAAGDAHLPDGVELGTRLDEPGGCAARAAYASRCAIVLVALVVCEIWDRPIADPGFAQEELQLLVFPARVPNPFDDDAQRWDRMEAQLPTSSRRAALIGFGVAWHAGYPGTAFALVPFGTLMVLLGGIECLLSRIH
jgi:hypothetical protein